MLCPSKAAGLGRTFWAPGASALARAAQAVDAVISRGASADAALAEYAGDAERAAVHAITLGTLRWYLRLAPPVERLLARPEDLAPEVRALLVTSAHQLEYCATAPETTVNAAVDAARISRPPRTAGLVNAVLRRFLREREPLLARSDAALPARTAHPAWLVERIAAAWPEERDAILAANNLHPPMTLRVDLSRISREDYCGQLAQMGIESQQTQWIDTALTLTHPVRIEDLLGFAAGLVSVQDAAPSWRLCCLVRRQGSPFWMPARHRAARPAPCSSGWARMPRSRRSTWMRDGSG